MIDRFAFDLNTAKGVDMTNKLQFVPSPVTPTDSPTLSVVVRRVMILLPFGKLTEM